MASIYAGLLIKAILRRFKFRIGEKHRRGLLVVMLCPFMSARSFRDAAETCGVQEYLLYEAIDELQDIPALNALRREGISRLISHLERLKKADSSVKSRKCVTYCGDDFTRKVRGDMGGLAHGCYSGADKRVVYGLKTEALIAVIGEGDEYFILDVRVIPPKQENPLFQRDTHIEWMKSALNRVDTKVRGFGLTLQGCYLSVDSAYASGDFIEEAKRLGLKLVSELKSSYIVWSWFWSRIPAGIYFRLFEIGHIDSFKPLGGDPEVMYFRHEVNTKVYGKILVVLFQIGGEIKRNFSTDSKMKAITVRRIAKRRWQLERVFWNLKQLLGFPMIHHQIRKRVLVRIYLAFHLAQVLKDCTTALKISGNELHKIIRRNPQALCARIKALSASVPRQSRKKAGEEGLGDWEET